MVPRHRRSTFGRRAFSVAGPMEWISLPHSPRDPAQSTNGLRSVLKTLCFCLQRTISALQALRDALYKSTTTTTTSSKMAACYDNDVTEAHTGWPQQSKPLSRIIIDKRITNRHYVSKSTRIL